MKIGFSMDINVKNANSGKHKFFIRLSKSFQSKGIEIGKDNIDIYLFLPGDKLHKRSIANVLRLDGLIMNTRWDYNNKNKIILKSIEQSDAIIYQEEFCKESYEKFLHVKKDVHTIIPNGAFFSEFYKREPKDYFLANCKWRPHKRLKSIIESYLTALEMGLESNLVITGDPDYKIKHPKIKYIGWQKDKDLKILLSKAIASLHLTWLDWCPNSMVEAIVSGCPVIYTKSGGQTNIGKDSGIGIDDTQWNFKLIDLYDPPPIDLIKVAESMIFFEKNKNKSFPYRNDLNIDTICDLYISYFKKVLSSK